MLREKVSSKFSENINIFLTNLETITNHTLYFFGSSVRMDYMHGCDIDMAMFSDNPSSLMSQIVGCLHIKKSDFKSFVHMEGNSLVDGHKLNYSNNDINVELVIYDTRFKERMLNFYETSANMPIVISITLLILKYLLKLGILNKRTYYKIKVFIFSNFVNSNKLIVLN